MRLWSIDPAQLDRIALVACWREALLAQKVLAGETRGYTKHPQLARFRDQPDPQAAIGSYLAGLADEATARGYRFDRTKIRCQLPPGHPPLSVTEGQIAYEWAHLLGKTVTRAPEWHNNIVTQTPRVYPLFTVIPGPKAEWERG